MNQELQNNALQRILSAIFDFKVLSNVLAIALLIGLFRSLIFKHAKPATLPGWVIIEMALTSQIVNSGGIGCRILKSIRRHGGSLFGLTSKHQVLINLPGLERLLSQPYHTIHAQPIQYTMATRIFGVSVKVGLEQKLESSWRGLVAAVERTYLNDAGTTEVLKKADIPQRAASFVTFSSKAEHMKMWERSACMQVVASDTPDKPEAVEANLQSLARDFGACVSIPLLYGQDFLDRYPQLLEDFWRFDNDLFPLLIIGIPKWAPFKKMKEGLAARARLNDQMEALYQRIDQYQRGEAVDFGADLSDIGKTALERNTVYEKENWSIRNRAEMDLPLLWGQNANAQQVLFWLLFYIYSTPGLVERIREEIAPHAKISQTSPPEITSMDPSVLTNNCQLLKACVLETYRMAIEVTSVRYIARLVSIEDGKYRHELKPGTFISAPHSLHQRDASVYKNPDTFDPDRFLQVDPQSGKFVARYGRLRPWGVGTMMCKGRTFAERQLMCIGAAIVSLWDIGPASGTWELPLMVPGTGARKAAKDVRVLIKRRSVV